MRRAGGLQESGPWASVFTKEKHGVPTPIHFKVRIIPTSALGGLPTGQQALNLRPLQILPTGSDHPYWLDARLYLRSGQPANGGGGVLGAGGWRVGLALGALAADRLLGRLRQLDAVQAQLQHTPPVNLEHIECVRGWY